MRLLPVFFLFWSLFDVGEAQDCKKRLGHRLDIEDLASISDEDIAKLVAATKEFGVVVIEGQHNFSWSEQIMVSRRMGKLSELPPSFEGGDRDPVEGYPALRRNANHWSNNGTWKGPSLFGGYLHQDGNFFPRPHRWLFSMLYCVQAPENGGETKFVDLKEPVKSLPVSLKNRARAAKITVNVRKIPDFAGGDPSHVDLFDVVQHPVLDSLPFSQEDDEDSEVLFLGNPFAPLEESDNDNKTETPLLSQLFDHCTSSDQFSYSHQWRPGDVVIWDNLQTLHQVLPYENREGHLRELYRTQIRMAPSKHHLDRSPMPQGWLPRYEDPETGSFVWSRRSAS